MGGGAAEIAARAKGSTVVGDRVEVEARTMEATEQALTAKRHTTCAPLPPSPHALT